MKALNPAIALCFVAGAAFADPVSYQPGSGPPNVVPSGRDVCWSEPADLNGLIGSSEQILAFGIETELANDFVTGFTSIIHATWWGGYYGNSVPCVPGVTTPGFNLRFYEDAGCIPGEIVCDLSITSFSEESMGCQAGYYPLFKWGADINCAIGCDLAWFGAQMKEHAFPPQAGRLASAGVVGCDSVFKSAYFSYPDWTPAIDVFGVPFDCSQEFTCGADPCGTPTHPSSWGRIKGLYR